MQQVTHASRTFTTTDEVCIALLELVSALDPQEHAEAVILPALDHEGVLVELKMTVNATSAFVIVPVEMDVPDEEALNRASAAAADELRSRVTTGPHSVATP